MGKASKGRRATKRKVEKQRRKAAKAALYKSYAEQGKNNSSKRSKKHKIISTIKGNHVIANCGNVGCEKCFPQFAAIPKNVSSVKVA